MLLVTCGLESVSPSFRQGRFSRLRTSFAVMLQELEVSVTRNSLRGLNIGVLSDRTQYAPLAKG